MMSSVDRDTAEIASRRDRCAAWLLCDRHPANQIAFTVIDPDLNSIDLTYGALCEQSRRCAAALADLGVGSGDRVGLLMGESVDLVVALLALWRRGAVAVPLSTALSSRAVDLRLRESGAELVVVSPDQLEKATDADGTGAWRVIVTGTFRAEGVTGLDALIDSADPNSFLADAAVGPDGALALLYTSGAMGTPEGVAVPVCALEGFESYLVHGLDLRRDDVYWNLADPGWAYGLYYGILAPLSSGRRNLLLRGGFCADLVGKVLAAFGVTNFAASPSVYRALRRDPTAIPPGARLRCASAAGQSLTEDLAAWAQRALGAQVRDHFGQAEVGMVVVDPWDSRIRPWPGMAGSGIPMPGWRLTVLHQHSKEPTGLGTLGRLAVYTFSPDMWFRGYTETVVPSDRFTADGRWYITGDAALAHPDGSFSVVAGNDDVLLIAGCLVRQSEVEDVLAAHPMVADAAVIGAPDGPLREGIEAYVALRPEASPNAALVAELEDFVKARHAAHVCPRTIHFVDGLLPRTPSGELRRAELRQQQLEMAG
jgi:acetyl-CoA synthetase